MLNSLGKVSDKKIKKKHEFKETRGEEGKSH